MPKLHEASAMPYIYLFWHTFYFFVFFFSLDYCCGIKKDQQVAVVFNYLK